MLEEIRKKTMQHSFLTGINFYKPNKHKHLFQIGVVNITQYQVTLKALCQMKTQKPETLDGEREEVNDGQIQFCMLFLLP